MGHAQHRRLPARLRRASSRTASSSGMVDSAPSRPKRFWPTYLVWRNCSNASAAFRRSRTWRCSSARQRRRHAFDVLLDPSLLVGILDVHVLDAERAAVGVAQDLEDVAERHGVACRPARRPRTPDRGPRWSARRWPDRARRAAWRARPASGSRSAIRWPRTRYMLMRLWTWTCFARRCELVVDGVARPAASGPARRARPSTAKTRRRSRARRSELRTRAQEQARLGALDDAVVVGRGDGDHRSHAELGERPGDRRPGTPPGSRGCRRR